MQNDYSHFVLYRIYAIFWQFRFLVKTLLGVQIMMTLIILIFKPES